MDNSMVGYFDKPHKLDRLSYISNAKIALAEDSLEYYFAKYGEGRERPQTQEMSEGKKLHFMLLEPEKFRQNRIIHRFNNLNSTEAKKWQEQKLREYPEAMLMSLDESLIYDKIIDKVMSHPIAGKIIKHASKEKHGYAKCDRTGAILYSRPDIITDYGDISDLKYVRSVDAFKFNRQQFSEMWYLQLSFYNIVDGLIRGKKNQGNCFYIAVENFYPHRVEVIILDQDFEAAGNIVFNDALDKILNCLQQDPKMKDLNVWRAESFKPKIIKPEYWMLNNDPRFSDLINLGA